MWPFNRKKEPDFGFKIELIQKHNNMIVYAGYGVRVLEDLSKANHCYQLRIKDELFDWKLKGTYRKPGEVRRKLREVLEEKHMNLVI